MSKNLRNNSSTQSLTIRDIGIVLLPSEMRNLDYIDAVSLAHSVDLIDALIHEDATGNDGTQDLTLNDAIDMFRDYQQKFEMSADNKLMANSTPRPKGTYTYFTGRADDLDLEQIGKGEKFWLYNDSTASEMSKDFKFLHSVDDGIYIRDGYYGYKNGGWEDCASMILVSEPTPLYDSTSGQLSVLDDHRIIGNPSGDKMFAGTPVLVPNWDTSGYWNYDSTSGLEFCPDATAAYDLYDNEHETFRFADEVPCYDNSYGLVYLDSDDCEQLQSGYFIRITFYNKSGQTGQRVWGILNMYRKRTL